MHEKILSNLAEVKARGAPLLAILPRSWQEAATIADDTIWLPDVADEPLHVEVVDGDGVGVLAHHHPHLVAVGDQPPGDVGAQKAVRADDELRSAHCLPPNCTSHAAASSSRVPSSLAFLHHSIPAWTNRSGL